MVNSDFMVKWGLIGMCRICIYIYIYAPNFSRNNLRLRLDVGETIVGKLHEQNPWLIGYCRQLHYLIYGGVDIILSGNPY